MKFSGSQVLLGVALLGVPSPGQQLAGTGAIPAIQKVFEAEASGPRLRCRFILVHPALTFALRFQTGYRIDIPLSQFHGAGHSITVHTRVTPEGRGPVYLTKTEQLPPVPVSDGDAEPAGDFVVGEGAYRVELLVQDDLQRTCRSDWKMQAQRSAVERQLTARTAPDAVEELATPVSPAAVGRDGLRIGRLTVLLQAAPLAPNFSKLQPGDVDRLADSLSALLAELPANSVRLIGFNLDQRGVLFRKDQFTAGQIGDLRAEIEKLQLATVDYRVLQRPEKPIDLLAGLLDTEVHDPHPPDALIVLGPRTRLEDGTPSNAAAARMAAPFPIFYLQCENAFRRMPGPMFGPTMGPARGRAPGGDGVPMGMPLGPVTLDAVERLVNGLKGETLTVRTPHDLAAAIHRMDGRIPRNAAPEEVTAARSLPDKTIAAPIAPDSPAPGAEAADPTGGENPIEVLVRLRDQVLPHAREIPNYTCVEAVRRDRYEPVEGRAPLSCDTLLARREAPDFSNRLKLDSTDWLRLDVAMTTTREIYSWAGASKFEEGDIDEVVPQGAIGTGPFASLLLGTFESRDRAFVFEGEQQQNGRRLFEYSFAVPQERSSYRVKAGKDWVITGYRGTLLVDPRTAELVRLAVETEVLPEETSTCEADNVLEYGLVQLGTSDFLLPKITHQRFIGRDGTEGENTVTFSACREYQTESTLSFGNRRPAGEGEARPSALDLPPGLPVTVELLTALRPGQAAAGDRLQGRLVKPIVNAHQKTLVPEGTPVEGRIMRIETRYAPRLETTVVFRWETIRMGGQPLPLSLLPNRQAPALKSGGRGHLRQRGMPIELPLPGESPYAVFHVSGERIAMESGSQSEWFTARPE